MIGVYQYSTTATVKNISAASDLECSSSSPVCSVRAVEDLHRLWKGYTDDLCSTSDSFSTVMKGLILQGCKLKVVEARNPMHVGLEGIVFGISSTFLHIASVREKYSKSEDGQFEVNARVSNIPKQGSSFTCVLPGKKQDRLITILGANLK